jgi:scyllo-inositol 2-dehydrogenase (NADP+)
MKQRIINTALCSFGMSGRVFHAPFVHTHPGFNLYSVWERSKNLAQQIYPAVKTERSLEALLADDEVELVVVNTPSITHFNYTKQALLAGKHVVVEKPFTATVQEAEELTALAAAQNRLLSVYHNRRYDSDFRTIKKVLDEGWPGELVDVSFHYDRYVPQLSPKPHKETPTPAVGCLYDLGSHLIDQALQMFGMPVKLFADMAANRPGSQVDDYFDIKLWYPSFRVTLKSSYFVREALPACQLHGKKGSFIKSRADVQEALLQAGAMPGGEGWGIEPETGRGLLHTERNGVVVKEWIPSERGNYGGYYEGLYEALVNGGPVPVTPQEGRNVIAVIEAAQKSWRQGAIVEL